ncbi:MAG TPA: HD domain-containing phosphohydrolase [bacterium]|nr:HD domain-containing phosphohydrolase [bacterium]
MSTDPKDLPAAPVLLRRTQKLGALLDVAKAMAAQKDLLSLIRLVVEEAVRVAEADRGTVWLLDRDRQELRTYVAQGLGGGAKELRIPMTAGIAGFVATSGRSLKVPDAYSDPRFDRTSDQRTGYKTRNILAVPMWSVDHTVFGVLQVLNKREDVDGGRFTEDDQELLTAFGAQAAASLQSAMLYEEIQHLFEGFIKASVIAIEARDPTTSGHSERVAVLTTGLAETLEKATTGRWKGTTFTPDEMREIRYAALLHDFGKIGVREEVLVKANKLYPHELEKVKIRFDYIRRSLEVESLERRYALVKPAGEAAVRDLIDQEMAKLEKATKELDELEEFVNACNKPTVLEQGGFERLQEIQKRTYAGRAGTAPFLTPEEVVSLSIPRGSLSQRERREIESHVTHTFKFLSQIPWSRALARIPEIAYGHHEKLDGKGYPRALPAETISVQTRMMTISDIYDALTASDRPYKKAVPHDKALGILEDEGKKGMIDQDLLQIFVEAKVPTRLTRS